jgi:hypothetical protein
VKRRLSAQEIRVALKAVFDAVAAEPVPKSIHDTLRRLK